MCGLCGIVNFGGEHVEEKRLGAMVKTLHHRGPDSSGVHITPNCGLAHARLSILDLSEHGSQPMHTADHRYTISYNGEVYNYLEVRDELKAIGVEFQGNSDTEVLLKSFEQWGEKAFARWNGMFACAIWDNVEHVLFLARDRFGIKPLYYSATDGQVVFGSEPKAIYASGLVDKVLCWASLGEYLHYGTSLGTNSFLKSVKRLEPGHFLRISREYSQATQYVNILSVDQTSDGFLTARDKVKTLLDEAVARHLVSDVPVGVFMSGGIDSSAIAAFASRHYPGKLATYSAGFDYDKGVNELPQAAALAKHFGTDHHELHIEAGQVPDIVEELCDAHDVPFGDSANIPLYLMSKYLEGRPKVILQGDGGDEIFGGYDRYARIRRQRFWRLLGKLSLWGAPYIDQNSRTYRAMRTMHALVQRDPALRAACLMSQEPMTDSPMRVFSASAREKIECHDPFSRYKQIFDRLSHQDDVQDMLLADTSIILPDLYFEKVDRATMANSIEVRVPMLDINLSRYAMSLPSDYKVKGTSKKHILRESLRGVVPDNILDAPKRGFGVPHQHWLRTTLSDFMRSVLLDPATLALGLFDQGQLELLIDEHVNGKKNNGMLLYKLLILCIWLRKQHVSLV